MLYTINNKEVSMTDTQVTSFEKLSNYKIMEDNHLQQDYLD